MTYSKEECTKAFIAKIDKQETDKCWNWIGAKTTAGYGEVRIGGRPYYAHRIMWELFFGEIPEGKWVLHKAECHNPSCVNPYHLYLGSPKDNVVDAIEAETFRRDLTKDQAAGVRRDYASGRFTHAELGRMYNVKEPTIQRILCRETYKEV